MQYLEVASPRVTYGAREMILIENNLIGGSNLLNFEQFIGSKAIGSAFVEVHRLHGRGNEHREIHISNPGLGFATIFRVEPARNRGFRLAPVMEPALIIDVVRVACGGMICDETRRQMSTKPDLSEFPLYVPEV